MRCNKEGLIIIKESESLHDGDPSTPSLEPEMCPAGIWNVGYGHALTDERGRFLKGAEGHAAALATWRRLWPNGMTRADADALLVSDVEALERRLSRLITTPLTDNQWSAVVSLTYNIGPGTPGGAFDFADSKTLAKINARDFAGAAAEFLDWYKSNGMVLRGLVARRRREAALFLS